MITIHPDVSYASGKVLAEKLVNMTPGYDPAKHLAVAASFLTVQGEMPFAGRPAVFLRLAGCNRGSKVDRGCTFCFPSHEMTAAFEWRLPLGDPSVIVQEPFPVTKRLVDLRVGDGLPSYTEHPHIDKSLVETPSRISSIIERKVLREALTQLTLVSSLNGDETRITVTKDHKFFVHERREQPEQDDPLRVLPQGDVIGSPPAGEEVVNEVSLQTIIHEPIFTAASDLRVGVDVLQGADLGPAYEGQVNYIYVREVRDLDEEEFQALIEDQIKGGVLDQYAPSFNRNEVSVTCVTCETVPTYIFKGIYVHNCDTFFTVGDKTRIMDLEDVVAEVVEKAKPAEAPILVITGGEPLLQAQALQMLLPMVAEQQVFDLIQFETNGDLFASNAAQELFALASVMNEDMADEESYDEYINFVISPKRTIKEPKTGAFVEFATDPGYFLRLVISGDPDSPYYTVPQFMLDQWPKSDFYISPLTEYSAIPKHNEIADIRTDIDIEATRRNVTRANKLAMQLGLKVSFQAHSYIGFE